MAGLTASIKLNDKMSATLNRIAEATNRATGSWNDLESATSSGLTASGVDAICKRLDYANGALVELVENQGKMTENINKSASASDSLLDKLKGIAGAIGIGAAVKKVVDLSDELTQTTARLEMMNDGAQTTDELFNMVYQAAQRSRGSVGDMADVVARFGNNAKTAFSSNAEVVAFSEIVQKQMTIAGASTAEASNAMLQLSQALGSGVLRGDELNSIFEQAPNLIQSIADYLHVPIGEIRELASEGQLSADVVKAAIFESAEDVNEKFKLMPATFGQTWQSIQNTALVAFQPVLQMINDMLNNERFQVVLNAITTGITYLAKLTIGLFNKMAVAIEWVRSNLSWIAPTIMIIVAAIAAYKVAMGIATVVQWAYNAALEACPIVWIITLIALAIALIIYVCQKIAEMSDTAESAFGVIAGGINVVIQFFKNLGLTVANIGLGIWEVMKAAAYNVQTAFHNAIASIQGWWYDMLSTVLGVIATICKALNKLPFISFDYSGITKKADEYARKSAEAYGSKREYRSLSEAFDKGFGTFDTFQDGWVSDAYDAGANWGDGITRKVTGFFDDFMGTDGLVDMAGIGDYSNAMMQNVGDINTNTADTAKALNIANEDIKYLRDLAERDTINRFTTAEVKVDLGGVSNTVSANTDLDGMISYLADNVASALQIVREGVDYA